MQQKRTGKRGWGDDAKHNLISVVKALLLLADEKLELDDSEFKTALQVEWYSEKKLRVTGEIKKKTSRSEKTSEVGTTKKALAHLVKKAGEKLELPKPKQGSNSSGEEREASAVQNVLDCLKVMGLLEDERPNNRTNTPYWKFTLTLKTQFSIEENLRWCEQKWNEHKQQNYSSKTTSKSATEDDINWREICGKVLAQQREKQLFRRSITGRGLGHEAKNVYVKLGLVKPKKQPQRSEDSQQSAEKGMLQYRLTEQEIEQEYQYKEFLEQVIEKKGKNFVIVGEPGAGKSTWLEQIAHHVDKSEKGFPICISLASLSGKTLEEYLLQIWLEYALPFISPKAFEVTPALKNKLKELFNSGQAWLLLDEVDEMCLGGYETPLQTISNQLRGWVDRARVVLTCRLNIWETNPNALPNFETYRTLHFDDEQVGDFIQQWFTQEGEPELGKKLQNKLSESGRERIRDLIKNPLRLAMLCGIWYFKPGDLPKTKAALYQRYIEYFYQWKPHPQLSDYLDKQEELHTALSKLALEAIDKKLPLRSRFAHKTMGQSLFKLARDVGWLNLVYKDSETGQDVYAFYHLTFQEYFAACAIDDWDYFLPREHKNRPVECKENPEKYKPYRIFDTKWKEVILLWLGRQGDEDFEKQKNMFVENLIKFEDGCGDFYQYRAYFLAAMGIAEFANCKYADEVVEQVIKWKFGAVNINNSNFRASALITKGAKAALLETHHEKIIDKLTRRLNSSPSEGNSLEIALTLIQIAPGNSVAVKIIVDYLDRTQESLNRSKFINLQRIQVMNQLEKFGASNPLAIAALAKVLPNKPISSSFNFSCFKPPTEPNDLQLLNLMTETDTDITNLEKAIGTLNDINILVVMLGRKLTLKTDIKELDNFKALIDFINRLDSKQSEFIARFITSINFLARNRLIEIASGDSTAVSTLVEMLCASDDGDISQGIVMVLGEAASIHIDATKAVIQLLQTTQDKIIAEDIIYFLKKIIKSDLLKVVIEALKDYIEEPEIYEIIWYCAQNMRYPDFYQAWHQTTIHQED